MQTLENVDFREDHTSQKATKLVLSSFNFIIRLFLVQKILAFSTEVLIYWCANKTRSNY